MPKIFISYSHDSPAHNDRILSLSNRLRADGLDSYIDQYEQSPAIGWPLWCQKQVEKADFVLVACTQTFLRRFNKEEIPGTGKGVTWEGGIITQELYNAQSGNNKFIPIIFSASDTAFIPIQLQGPSRFLLPDDYDKLYRLLTMQPELIAPPIGAVKAMPAREPLVPMPVLDRKAPTVWMVPYAPSPFFTGRDKVVADLHVSLQHRKTVALSGLGGVGKTRTAVEYAYRHRADYTSVFWVRAEERNTLLSDFAAIAAAIHLPTADAKEQDKAAADVRHWLSSNTGWLLILDNSDDLNLAKEFITVDPQGCVLITTRAHSAGEIAERISLDEMGPEEGALLLLRRAQVIPRYALLDAAKAEDKSLALKIAAELGGLPLALDQAGAFIEETPSTLEEYHQIYSFKQVSLLSERGGNLGDHPSVTVTFSLAFDKVAHNSDAAADIVRLCAFLAPTAIPEIVFTRAANFDQLAFAKALREAGRFSLLERDAQSKTVYLHRLVQLVIRGAMDGPSQKVWAERAIRSANSAFPSTQFANWKLCEALLPHARICANLIDQWSFDFLEASTLLNQTGLYLMRRALYSEAELHLKRSLQIRENTLQPNDSAISVVLSNLALVYKSQGKFTAAEPLYLRALDINESAFGKNHERVAEVVNNLAALYREQTRYSEAGPLYRRALDIFEHKHGPEDLTLAVGLNNLGLLYIDEKKYQDAEELLIRARTIQEKTLKPNDPDLAGTLNNLAVLYNNQGKFREARPLFAQALNIWQTSLGPDHPRTQLAAANLGGLISHEIA